MKETLERERTKSSLISTHSGVLDKRKETLNNYIDCSVDKGAAKPDMSWGLTRTNSHKLLAFISPDACYSTRTPAPPTVNLIKRHYIYPRIIFWVHGHSTRLGDNL